MPAIRSAADIARKWAEVTPLRAGDYEAGVRAPKVDWQTATEEAADAWGEGVEKARAEGRFAAGVRKATTAKWQRKAIEVGVRRWPDGVRVAQPDYQAGFAPYRDVIERTVLPPRYAKGDPRNIERVREMAMALHRAKVGGS